MPSITEPSEYVLEPIREGAEFTLYRGRQHANPSPVLAVALSAEQPSPQGLWRLEHEYSLAAELDPAWAARPLALTRHEGRRILGLLRSWAVSPSPGVLSARGSLAANRRRTPRGATSTRRRTWPTSRGK